jgi:hypothetical protein
MKATLTLVLQIILPRETRFNWSGVARRTIFCFKLVDLK